jgi:hypothetical protein
MSIDKKPTNQSICVGTTQPELCDMATDMSIILKSDNATNTDVTINHQLITIIHALN